MKTHRHHARTLELTFKPKYQILSITFPVQLNPWRRVTKTWVQKIPCYEGTGSEAVRRGPGHGFPSRVASTWWQVHYFLLR